MNDIQVVLRGNIASDPRFITFDDGNCVTSFRLASTSSWYDRERETWVDRRTTYVSVNCRRILAKSAMQSLHKGHPVVITGRLWERSWTKDDRAGRTLEVEAETVGHDLTFGVSAFTRFPRNRHVGEELAAREGRPVDETDPAAAAVYGAVREIGEPMADVTGFEVLEDGADLDEETVSGGKVSALG
ncbi:single-stranded DNA-binding protein [Kineosporia succinea]|uniref:Single-stranded DNA-binding protein n=1 Tax=Kineosporia succinea TaxID=84632 RepID=A0ABT9NXH9_9ACTN|nr:single-stranded DNA-binding protein [Kineosporia succinea]MDP9825133.1 single-strand DNA-binding protein [Kineosporia succinea]